MFVLFCLKINFNPLVCCCMKPFMRARKSRRDVAKDSDKKGNFCCSKIGPLIAESGNMITGTCNLGHNFFKYLIYNWSFEKFLSWVSLTFSGRGGWGEGAINIGWRQKDSRTRKTLEGETTICLITSQN